MLNISDGLKELLKNNQRALVKIKCGNFIFGFDDETDPQNSIDNSDVMELSVQRIASNDGYPLGNSYACCADVTLWDIPLTSKLKGQKTEVFIGYMNGNSIEWIPMGIYYPEKPTRSDQLLSFTAYDKMYSLSYPYAASIAGNQTPFAILQDLARFGGFDLDESVSIIAAGNWGTIPVSLLYGTETDENGESNVTSYNVNDCIGYVAGFLGANAMFNREGKLQLFRFNEVTNTDGTPYAITDDEVQDVNVDEDNHTISYVYCNNGREELCVPENTVMSASTGVQLNNPLITSQEQLERIYTAISDAEGNFIYRPLTLRHLSANPALQCYDIIRYTDTDGNTYRFPIMAANFIYDGSLVCDLQSLAKSQEESISSGSVLSRVLAPIVQENTKQLAQLVEKATQAITGNTGGYAALVDTDGDNIPDNFISSEYPVDLAAGSDWRTKGNCVRINKNGIAVSTTGADGPFKNFAVYFDKTLNKYLVNADDIKVGTLQGIKIIAEEGSVGGWNINAYKIYGGDTANGERTAVMQLPPTANGERAWVFAAGGSSHNNYSDCPFRVNYLGKLYASDSEISGKITATSGTIGGFNIEEKRIWTSYPEVDNGTDDYFSASIRRYDYGESTGTFLSVYHLFTNENSQREYEYPFIVKYNGDTTIQNLNITGSMEFTKDTYIYSWDGEAAFTPGNINGNTVIGYGRYAHENGGTGIYGGSSVYIISKHDFSVDVHYGIRIINANDSLVDSSGNATHNLYFGRSSTRVTDPEKEADKLYAFSNTCVRGQNVRLYSHAGGGVYLGASGATAVTSDENLKNITDIDSRYEQFFMNLKPILYTYKDVGHRKHIGYGARAVEKALQDADLTTEEFAGILIDKDVTLSADEMRTDDDVHFDDLYSLRYEEFGALYAHMLQKAINKIDALESTVQNQQQEIDTLKSTVEMLCEEIKKMSRSKSCS